jgi:hypothetical protein
MNSYLKEKNIDYFNYYTYFRDNSGALNGELVVINLLQINSVSALKVTGLLSQKRLWIFILYNIMLTLEKRNYFYFSFKETGF